MSSQELRISKMLDRLRAVEELLSSSAVLQDQKRFRELTQEHSYLHDLSSCYQEFDETRRALVENEKHLKSEADKELVELLRSEIEQLQLKLPRLESKLHALLVPPDPLDSCDTILELRAGTGGDEAALFVGDCVRMYQLLAGRRGWRFETLSASPSELGGFREYIMGLSGREVYRFLRHEGGTHRVQRVPDTETQGRVHTSTITVAVLVEPEEVEEIKLDERDLRIETFRSSGAGGQHVNTTDSAVRITHLPTGVVTSSQQQRSQHQNREMALRLLKAKLLEQKILEREKNIASSRSQQVGTGERSERIRTYNFSQNRVTDHRIGMTLYNLAGVMQGDLDDFIEALVGHYYQKQLAGDEEVIA